MLKVGKVYQVGKNFVLIAGKRRYKRRLIYTVRRVYSNGTLGTESERMFKRNECKLVKNAKVVTYVQLPEKVKHKDRFDNLVSRAKQLISDKDENYQKEVAKLAICVSGYQHQIEGRACNLRDFAREVGFKSFNTLYKWVLAYYSFHYTERKFKVAIPSAADSTIVGMIREHQESYSSFYGFNKKLDALLQKNARAYLKEFRLRGLSL